MGDYRASADAWRKYARTRCRGDDEIEAEATAQLLRRDEAEGHIDDLMVRVGINDFDKLEQALLANRRSEKACRRYEAIRGRWPAPPRAIFAIYNKNRLDSAANLRCTDIPVIIAHAYIFGKKKPTAPARIELDVYRSQLLDATIAVLREIAGDAIGGIEAEESRARSRQSNSP